MTWDRRWYSLARLVHDGEVIGEVSLNNGLWSGTYRGWSVELLSARPDTIMEHVAEVARLDSISREHAAMSLEILEMAPKMPWIG